MNPIVPDLAIPLRTALLGNSTIAFTLPEYLDSQPVFTRRPVPPDAPYPMIVVSPNISEMAVDGFDDNRPVITRDIAIYGQNDTADNYRTVEAISNIVYAMFHHVRFSIPIDPDTGWNVVDVHCRGPTPAPADDDLHVGRIVSLEIHLANRRVGDDDDE